MSVLIKLSCCVTKPLLLLVLGSLFISARVGYASGNTVSQTSANSVVAKTPQHLPSLTPFKAIYASNWNGLSIGGDVEYRLKKDGDGYRMSTFASALFIKAEETVRFMLSEGRPKPQSFQKTRSRFGRKKVDRVNFNWEQSLAKFNTPKRSGEVEIGDDVLDRVSVQLAVRCDLRGAKRSDRLSYSVFDRRRLKPYDFLVDGEERISTPMGEFETVKLVRERHDKKRKTTMWLAKDSDFFVVQIHQQTEDDDTLLSLKSVSPSLEQIEALPCR